MKKSFLAMKAILAFIAFAIVGSSSGAAAENLAKPLKVYIMAGQSNMVGTGAIKTFDYIGDDPKTAPLLEQMRGPDGKPYVCKRVWISYLNGRQNQYGGEGIGRLTAGYGLRDKDKHSEPWDYIGPEFMFGITMERNYDGPILIIKTAWGGQSLSVDYRSPSAGPYVLNDFQRELYGEQGRLEQNLAAKRKQTGQNYRWMIEHVKKVLADIKRVYPDYDPSRGYEVAGFVWFQGFNDLIDSHTYPRNLGTNRFDLYSELLTHFIRDVRGDLDAPDMKFVIGVAGQNGNFTPGSFDTRGGTERWLKCFRQAMAAPASMPEFRGNVAAVQTAPYWDVKLGFISMKQKKAKWMSSHLRDQHKGHPNENGTMTRQEQQDYLAKYRKELITPEDELLLERAASIGGSIHYFGSAKFHAQAGKSFAEAILEMEKK
jgi:alpha-galactosidase